MAALLEMLPFPYVEFWWPIFLLIPVLIFRTFSHSSTSVLKPDTWLKFKLERKITISHNTALYRFALPRSIDILGLPIGQHISVRFEIDGKLMSRSYTPTTLDQDLGHFDLVVKTYPTGNVSKKFAELSVGEEVEMRGPKGAFKYTPNMVKHLTMVAGGTGITPMFQILKAILRDPKDKTTISLIFANVNEDDILLKKELDDYSSIHSEKLSVYYVLNNPPKNWDGGVGFVTKEMIQDRCPPSLIGTDDLKVLLCGPPPMIKAMTQYCVDIGIGPNPPAVSKAEDRIFKF